MASDKLAYSDAMTDPAARAQIEQMVMMMRVALAPVFNADLDNLPMNQSLSITAAAMLAGMTAGHMIALEILHDKDKRRVGQAVLANFRDAIELGKDEARRAILEQTPAMGQA